MINFNLNFVNLLIYNRSLDISRSKRIFSNAIYRQFTSLYRICCIEHTWLFVNAQCYALLCISYSKYIFLYLIARNQQNFWKTYENIYTLFSFTQFDSTKPIQLLKTYAKNVYKCIGFLHENYQQQVYTVV